MSLPKHYLRVGAVERELQPASIDPERERRDIEPWLSAVFQSEHISLLVGSGLATAVALEAGATPADMSIPSFGCPNEALVLKRAATLAARSSRGDSNFEDALRAALQLVAGLEVLEQPDAEVWKGGIDQVLRRFVDSVLTMERGIANSVATGGVSGAVDSLVSFLLSFASRASSRERLNLFTTNYDRLLEFGCDAAGIRPLDRFVGGLSPIFRASRLDVDMHYNPPGMRGEPRYLEGVIRLTKLHGSIDWRYQGDAIRRVALPFGATAGDPKQALDAYESLIIFPNPAKDMETAEYPYAELFRDFSAALCRPNSALVTYGYGFGDDHINRVIKDMLSIPSTHLVAIAYADPGDRLDRFLTVAGRRAQVSLLVGAHLADLSNLVQYYLPKPAIDTVTMRQSELLRRRDISDRTHSATKGPDDVVAS